MKKVLIISFYFPPNNTIGAVRIGKFAKYLPEFGWEPIILTVNDIIGLKQTLPVEINESQIVRTRYYSLFDMLTGSTTSPKKCPSYGLTKQRNKIKSTVIKLARLGKPIYSLPLIRTLLFEQLGWYKYAIQAGLEIIKNNDIDIIFSTYGPCVPHLIASKLQKITKIPWVADFRDPWSDNAYFRKTQPFHFFEDQWEKYTIKNSYLLISVSKPLANALTKLHKKKTIVISNGYDEEDYKEQVPESNKFIITYTGNIYPGKRDPSPLFQALGELKRNNKISSEDIEVRFFGQNIIETLSSLIEKFNIKDFIRLGGNISFKESIKNQMMSTVLLLLSWNDSRDAGTLPAKFFEYLGAKKPILALAYKDSEIDILLNDTGCGLIANEVPEIEYVLMEWIVEFKKYNKLISFYNPNVDLIKNYNRKAQAEKLAEVFNRLE